MDTPDDPKPEETEYSLNEVTRNQAKINYLFNHIDTKMIEILKTTVQILKAVKASPSLTREMRGIDFTTIDFTCIEEGLSQIEKQSGVVASIKPPGCDPYPW